MKQFLIVLSVLLGLLIPATVAAQPAPPLPHRPGYDVVKHCYTVLIPYPHSRCEWVHVRYDYRPVPPPPPHHRNYTPAPPPGPRPGHHPPPPPHHGGHGHHGHGGPHH